MSGRVIVEVQNPGDGDTWIHLGSVTPDEPRGTITDDTPTGRDVYAFGWFRGEGPGLWKSITGLNVNVTGDLVRVDLRLIADLRDGPATVTAAALTGAVTYRFTHSLEAAV